MARKAWRLRLVRAYAGSTGDDMTFEQIKNAIRQARDPEIIMLLLGIAQAVGISSALILADGETADTMTRIFSFLRGSTMGTALSFGLMGVSHNAPRMKAKQAQNLAYAALVALLIVSPVIIAPAVQAGIPSRILADPLARWLWAAAIAIAPDFVAVAIAVTSKGIAEEKPAISEVKPVKAEPKPAISYPCSACGRSFGTQAALNGHASKHKAKDGTK